MKINVLTLHMVMQNENQCSNITYGYALMRGFTYTVGSICDTIICQVDMYHGHLDGGVNGC